MLAKERKPQAHSPSLRSIKHCNQPVLSQRRAQHEYSSRNERKKPKLLPAISLKRKAKAKSEARNRSASKSSPQQFHPKGEQSKKRSKKAKKGKLKLHAPLPAISPKRKAKAKSERKKAKKHKQKLHLPTAISLKGRRKQESKSPTSPQRFRPKGEERRASQRKNPVLSFKAKSGEAEHGEKKRRLFERSEFLRFRRAKPRSRLETADGGFSFCYLFLFAAKKKK